MEDFVRRTIDLVGSLCLLVVLSPLLAVVAFGIMMTSPGAPIYRGLRVGRNGKRFRITKFRTMILDADRKGGEIVGIADPRVTKFGNFLRAKKLDELPQLFNVVMGDMSLVGPRPESEMYAESFSEGEKRILSVKPGITDLASLEFFRMETHVGLGDPDFIYRTKILPRKNELRMQYLDRRCIALDLSIIARTGLKVIGGLSNVVFPVAAVGRLLRRPLALRGWKRAMLARQTLR